MVNEAIMNSTSSIIGAQLYVYGKRFPHDLEAILQTLSSAGYGAIESFRIERDDCRQLLDQFNLRYAALHCNPKQLDDIDGVVKYLGALESHDICSSGPLDWNGRSVDDYIATARALNETGKRLREAGIHLHYHNHEFEFECIDGQITAMDVLLKYFEPDAVDLCFDAGWAWRAGVDPVAFMRRHGEHIGYLHLRDFQGGQAVALGQGEMAVAAVVQAARELPRSRWMVVEQDPTTTDADGDMIASRKHLRGVCGL